MQWRFFQMTKLTPITKMLESCGQRRTRRECSPSSQLFRAGLDCEGQKGTPFFVLWTLDRVISLSTFGKKWVFALSPHVHPVNTKSICGMDAAWLSILCFTADLTSFLGPRSSCTHFILKNWWWHCGKAGRIDQLYLLCLKLSLIEG